MKAGDVLKRVFKKNEAFTETVCSPQSRLGVRKKSTDQVVNSEYFMECTSSLLSGRRPHSSPTPHSEHFQLACGRTCPPRS